MRTMVTHAKVVDVGIRGLRFSLVQVVRRILPECSESQRSAALRQARGLYDYYHVQRALTRFLFLKTSSGNSSQLCNMHLPLAARVRLLCSDTLTIHLIRNRSIALTPIKILDL